MYGAVQLKSASRGKRSRRLAIAAREVDVNGWGSSFFAWLGRCAVPGTIDDDMRCGRCIDQRDRFALFDGDRFVDEVGGSHFDLWAGRDSACIPDGAGSKQNGQQGKTSYD